MCTFLSQRMGHEEAGGQACASVTGLALAQCLSTSCTFSLPQAAVRTSFGRVCLCLYPEGITSGAMRALLVNPFGNPLEGALMEMVGVALVLGLWEAGVGGSGGVLVLLVVPWPLALWEWRSPCGMDRLVLVVGSGVAVRWRWRALARVLLRARCGLWIYLGPLPVIIATVKRPSGKSKTDLEASGIYW